MSCSRGCCRSQPDHYRSLSWTTDPQARAVTRKDEADMAAYARLRKDGLQPRAIDGSAGLERTAEITSEVERGHLVKNAKLRKEITERTGA